MNESNNKSINRSAINHIENFPCIRPGNQVIQLINGSYYIGNSRRGVCFNEAERYRFLQYCDGNRNLEEISKIIGTQTSKLIEFLNDGIASRYLVELLEGRSKNFTDTTLKSRRDCEYDFYLRYKSEKKLSGVENVAPAKLFEERSNKEVLIFGTNQFTISLLALLQAAGFSKSRIIGSFNKDNSQVIADDLSGSVIQSSDIGSTLSQISKRIIREHQLVNIGNYSNLSTVKPQSTKPSLIIAMQPIPVDYQQRWLSESTPHLVIGSIIDNQLEIGPLVIPGGSTCLRCIDLTAVANALSPEIATLNYLNSIERLPAAVLSILAGMVAVFATEFLDGEIKSAIHPLISAALRVDLTNPCKQSHIRWQANSMCGCGANLAQYANGRS